MTILNETELKANIANRFPDQNLQLISPADLRQQFTDNIESLQSYGGVITDGVVTGLSITATPTKWPHFSTNNTSPNAILEADAANDRILCYEPCLTFLTLRFFGSWAVNEDLRFAVYINGAANPITPIDFAQEGNGAADPNTVSVTDIAFIVNSAAISAGGGQAVIELFLYSDTGTFTLNQDDIVMGMEYNPLSIRTVG